MKRSRARQRDARDHLLAMRLAVRAEQLPDDQVADLGQRGAIGHIDAQALPHHACRGDEFKLRDRAFGKRYQLRSARARFLDVAPLDAPGKCDARTVFARMDIAHVDMPARPVVHAGGKQHRGVDRRLYGIEVQPGMQHADSEGGLRDIWLALMKGRQRGGARDAVGDAFVHGP